MKIIPILILACITGGGCASTFLSEYQLSQKDNQTLLRERKSYARSPNLYAEHIRRIDAELERRRSDPNYLNPAKKKGE
jgi:hypothetical protein